MRKCCFFDILFLYCFLEKRHVYILTGFQMVTKSQNRLAELRYDTNELNKEATTEKISVVQQEGAREVRRNTLFYNLDAIISVGYRVNSIRATQFRQWCTYVIWQFSLRGYIIDKKRMENGSFIGEDYFEHLTPSETPQKHQTEYHKNTKRFAESTRRRFHFILS